MNTDTIRNIRKKNLLILFFAILILMLNVFLPIVSMKTDTDPKQDQYLNLEAMKGINDESLNSLSNNINQINLLLWVLTIIGFFSFLGLILKLSEKVNMLSNIFIISGCATLVLSIISCLLTLLILRSINNIDGVSPAFIYLNLLLIVILTIITISFTVKIVKYSLDGFRKSKKDKNKIPDEKEIGDIAKIKKADSKEEVEKPVKKPIKFKMDDWDNKRTETTEFSEKNNTKIDFDEEIKFQEDKKTERIKETLQTDQESKTLDTEKQTKDINEFDESFAQEEKKAKEAEEEKEDTEISDSFEKALEYAIKKKKEGIKQRPTSDPVKIEKKTISGSKEELKKEISKEIEKNKKIVFEKFNVKCPECGSIFEAEKQPDGVTRIKCPKCGKDGVIK